MVTHDIGAVIVHTNKIAYVGDKGLVMNENTKDFVKNNLGGVYGYDVNFHANRHCCTNCWKKGAV